MSATPVGLDIRYHGFGVFDKAVSSLFDNVFEEHGITEDGKTVAPFSRRFVPNAHCPTRRGGPSGNSMISLIAESKAARNRRATFESRCAYEPMAFELQFAVNSREAAQE